MKAIYPMVGASAAACAQNLKSSSFTGTFSSGWTFASTGVTGNGTSAYFDTNFNTQTNQSVNNCALSVYLRTATIGSGYISDFGNAVGPTFLPLTVLESNGTGRGQYCWDYNTAIATITTSDSRGMWGVSRTGASTWQSFERNTAVAKTTTTAQTTLPNSNVYAGAINDRGTPIQFTTRQIAFAHIGDGLTNTQFNNFYTAVQTFNTTLNRSVGTPTVSDADAQAYINRVYTAGGTLTNTEANAVNQLTIDMKAAGIWTAMKAVYPMVGASAAACAQNLKSSSFTGTFTSGWTFASTGVTPNGTSAYMDTAFNPNLFTSNNCHLSYYSRTNSTIVTVAREMGVNNIAGAAYNPEYSIFLKDGSLGGASIGDYNKGCSGTTTNSDYFSIASRTSATSIKLYKNNTILASSTSSNSLTACALNIYLGCVNFGGTADRFSNRQCAFSSIGDGLTDTQATDFYTCVQTFQTTIARQIAP
jgi:hypothetical protein